MLLSWEWCLVFLYGVSRSIFFYLEVLGTVGLILIVLEEALGLKLLKSQYSYNF